MKQHSRTEIEQEIAYEWIGQAHLVDSISSLENWTKTEEDYYSLVDSIYDTEDHKLGKHKMGVRVRSAKNSTTLTAKRFIERRTSGENIFEEQHVELSGDEHPLRIEKENGITFPAGIGKLQKILEIVNSRKIFTFTKGESTIEVINETISYADDRRVVEDHLLEVEFENVPDDVITAVKSELEKQYNLEQLQEGKTDRALRLLEKTASQPLIQNIENIDPLVMSAHGGKGEISMKFFHQPYNHFSAPGIGSKVVGYERSNWDFFAYAELPAALAKRLFILGKMKRHRSASEDALSLAVDLQRHAVPTGLTPLGRAG